MYATARRLYLAGSLSDAGLDNLVTKKLLTATQAEQIRQDAYLAGADLLALDRLVLDAAN